MQAADTKAECLLAYQQTVLDLTAMDLANASLLDEATAALDSTIEGKVMEAVQRRLQGRTIIVIAHYHCLSWPTSRAATGARGANGGAGLGEGTTFRVGLPVGS